MMFLSQVVSRHVISCLVWTCQNRCPLEVLGRSSVTRCHPDLPSLRLWQKYGCLQMRALLMVTHPKSVVNFWEHALKT